jgi:hypothetical protein
MSRRRSLTFSSLFLAFSAFASADNYGNLTETANAQTFYYSSELDRRDAINRDRKYAEKQARAERERAERAEKQQRAEAQRQANRYVSKAPEQTQLIVNMAQGPMTADQIVSAMVEKQQSAAPAAPAPPQKSGMLMVVVGDDVFYYRDGEFYVDNDGDLLRTAAPLGAAIFKLPPTAQVVRINGKNYFLVGDTCFEKAVLSGTTVYRVVSMPIEDGKG